MHDLPRLDSGDKDRDYAELGASLAALLDGEHDLIACAASTAALLYYGLQELNWAGFYFRDPLSQDLLVGPFQGRPACIRIPAGKGVCGTAATQRRTIVVPDVLAFPGHIACDAASRSEIVVPIIAMEPGGEPLLGVLDLDSPLPGRFDAADARGLEEIVRTLVAAIRR